MNLVYAKLTNDKFWFTIITPNDFAQTLATILQQDGATTFSVSEYNPTSPVSLLYYLIHSKPNTSNTLLSLLIPELKTLIVQYIPVDLIQTFFQDLKRHEVYELIHELKKENVNKNSVTLLTTTSLFQSKLQTQYKVITPFETKTISTQEMTKLEPNLSLLHKPVSYNQLREALKQDGLSIHYNTNFQKVSFAPLPNSILHHFIFK